MSDEAINPSSRYVPTGHMSVAVQLSSWQFYSAPRTQSPLHSAQGLSWSTQRSEYDVLSGSRDQWISSVLDRGLESDVVSFGPDSFVLPEPQVRVTSPSHSPFSKACEPQMTFDGTLQAQDMLFGSPFFSLPRCLLGRSDMGNAPDLFYRPP